jgi:MoaD family protein
MITVKFFSHLRRALGTKEAEFGSGNIGQLMTDLEARYGDEFKGRIGHCKVYVNGTSVGLGKGKRTRLRDGDEVVILPPVAGGLVPLVHRGEIGDVEGVDTWRGGTHVLTPLVRVRRDGDRPGSSSRRNSVRL